MVKRYPKKWFGGIFNPLGRAFDGDDYIEIPKINSIEGQIRFFCCPIDFHTILRILKAIFKNWGRNCIYIIGQNQPNDYPFCKAKWMTKGRSF